MQQLQGDAPFHVRIEAQIDDAESALAQLALNAIGTDLIGSDDQRRGRWTFRNGDRLGEQAIERRQRAVELRMARQQRLAVHGPAGLQVVEHGIERRRRFRIQ